MDEALKSAFETELSMLYERAEKFAEAHPSVAQRLGGLSQNHLDPSVGALLEGVAYLTARLQVERKTQFRSLTGELLEHLFPDVTAPLPAATLLQVSELPRSTDLAEGLRFQAGSMAETKRVGSDRSHPCRFRLAEPLEVWPINVLEARWVTGAAQLEQSGLTCDPSTAAGLVVKLGRSDVGTRSNQGGFGVLPIKRLPIHFLGIERDSRALYGHIVASTLALSVRWTDKLGASRARRIPVEAIEPLGFDEDLPLYAKRGGALPAVSFLLEFFAFPSKFRGVVLSGLDEHLEGIESNDIELVFELPETDRRLQANVEPRSIGLFCAPAVNLFDTVTRTVQLEYGTQDRILVTDETPHHHFEIIRVTGVSARYEGGQKRVPVSPLFARLDGKDASRSELYYSISREPRDMDESERELGKFVSGYRGTQTRVSIHDPPTDPPLWELYVRAECSNRHLVKSAAIDEVPVVLSGGDKKTKVKLLSVALSDPRESILQRDAESSFDTIAGDNELRLLSLMMLNSRGIAGDDGTGDVEAVREMLRLFADPSERAAHAELIGCLKSVTIEPITRVLARKDGFFPARGQRISLSFDGTALEMGDAVLLTAVLDRVFPAWSSINSFTECELLGKDGRAIIRFPPRDGTGPLS